MHAPPFRPLSLREDKAEVEMINRSGAQVVFVGLGCPKQEKWMAAHRDRINAVMIGVGAAFDYHAGTIKRAPLWWQHNGLEWLYRLGSDPQRLLKRYMVTNTLFIIGFSKQLIAKKILKHVTRTES
jgi:N-acetylglucosaminyldiphosphoundecaprenol N-acetyl-beta-D-mannosaminyltransferase